MYLKHLAWLDATPEPKKDQKPQQRREQLAGNPLLKLPEIEYPHLLEWLFDFGPYALGPNGIIPVSYQEIDAWSRITKIDLVEDEPEILRRLSVDYCGMFNRAKDRDCPPPYVDQAGFDQDEMTSIRAKVALQLQKLKQKAQKG